MGNKSRIVFNITYHAVFLKLKKVLSEIHLLSTPDREHGKVFEKVPIVGFRRAKSLNYILVRAKVAPLEKKKRKGVADHPEVLGAKYANMLLLLKHLELSVHKENIVSSPII